ncbi:hypothetical protein NA633_09690 [Pseudomonas stutzeri]|uniref:hypothetical protein n=1 Tax=Stutzerimonas stutzeri TaxID=316 RepID=UPI001184C24C|nr:hypothetical protein [Stutzerimonas stutzeri]MCQ4283371.1 hypothetical protein [Stutzerimonas stutzeri]
MLHPVQQKAMKQHRPARYCHIDHPKKTADGADFWATAVSYSTKVAALFASTSRATCLMDMPN